MQRQTAINHRRLVKFDKMPASTLAKFALKENAYVTGQHNDHELLNDLRSLARRYPNAYFKGHIVWYTNKDLEHGEYPTHYDIGLFVEGIKIYDQLSRQTLVQLLADKEFSSADRKIVTDSTDPNKLNLELWWD